MHKNATRQLVNERTSLPNLNMSSVSQRFKPKGRPTPRCSTDGGFLLHQLSAWPARGTFLDDGLAKGIAQLVGNATVLDVGAGSGQYDIVPRAARLGPRCSPLAWHRWCEWRRRVHTSIGPTWGGDGLCKPVRCVGRRPAADARLGNVAGGRRAYTPSLLDQLPAPAAYCQSLRHHPHVEHRLRERHLPHLLPRAARRRVAF